MFPYKTATAVEQQERKADITYLDAQLALKANLAGATATGAFQFTAGVITGENTVDLTGIDINGTIYDAYDKVCNVGGTIRAQLILNRHSTTLAPLIVGARSNAETTAHTAVTTGQELLSLWGTGITSASGHHDVFGSMDFVVGTGTVSATSSPGKWVVKLTPDGSNTPAEVLSIDSNAAATFAGSVTFASASFTSISLADGTAAAPSLRHTGDTNTGIYFSALDNIDFTCGGVNALNLKATAAVFAGSVATTSIILGGTTLTPTGVELNYVDGVTSAIQTQLDDRVFVSGDTMTGALGIIAGTVLAPGLFVSGDTNTGIYSSTADIIDFTCGGVNRFSIDPITFGAVKSSLKFLSPDGTSAAPGYGFSNDLDTGMYLAATGILVLCSAGVDRLTFNGTLTTFGLVTPWDGGTAGIVGAFSSVNATPSGGGNLRVVTSDSMAIDLGGSIALGGSYSGTSAYIDFANISGRKENGTGGNAAGYFSIATRDSGGNTTEKMRVASTGNVGLLAGAKIFLDGINYSGDTYILESSANVVDVYAGGNRTLSLTSTDVVVQKTAGRGFKVDPAAPTFPWHDIVGAITYDAEAAANRPNFVTYRNGVKGYQYAVSDQVYLEFHIPHDYAPGTDIHIHVHWSHTSVGVTSGSATWGFEATYAKGHNQAAFPATITTTVAQAASTTQYQHMIAETPLSAAAGAGGLLNSDNLEPDGVILVRLYLSANTISAATDPFSHFCDLHYQSVGIGTKQKAPAFYT